MINIFDRNGILYSAEAESLNINTANGYQTIFAEHTPFISTVEKGHLEVKGYSNYKLDGITSGLIKVDFDKIIVVLKDRDKGKDNG